MAGRRLLMFVLSVLIFLFQINNANDAMANIQSDRISLPPPKLERLSSNQQYLLMIQSKDNWKTPHPVASLYRFKAAGSTRLKTMLWQGICLITMDLVTPW